VIVLIGLGFIISSLFKKFPKPDNSLNK